MNNNSFNIAKLLAKQSDHSFQTTCKLKFTRNSQSKRTNDYN